MLTNSKRILSVMALMGLSGSGFAIESTMEQSDLPYYAVVPGTGYDAKTGQFKIDNLTFDTDKMGSFLRQDASGSTFIINELNSNFDSFARSGGTNIDINTSFQYFFLKATFGFSTKLAHKISGANLGLKGTFSRISDGIILSFKAASTSPCELESMMLERFKSDVEKVKKDPSYSVVFYGRYGDYFVSGVDLWNYSTANYTLTTHTQKSTFSMIAGASMDTTASAFNVVGGGVKVNAEAWGGNQVVCMNNSSHEYQIFWCDTPPGKSTVDGAEDGRLYLYPLNLSALPKSMKVTIPPVFPDMPYEMINKLKESLNE